MTRAPGAKVASPCAAAVDDDASMLRKGQPLICWGTALLRPKSIALLHTRLPGSPQTNLCVIPQRYMQRYTLRMLSACISSYLSALYFSRDFTAVLWVRLGRCRPEISLRFPEKNPNPPCTCRWARVLPRTNCISCIRTVKRASLRRICSLLCTLSIAESRELRVRLRAALHIIICRGSPLRRS